jgi:hypothetical protein
MLLTALVVSGAVLGGCKKGGGREPETYNVVNTRCPLTGKEINPLGVPRDYAVELDGQWYGFAPDANMDEWRALSDTEKKQKAAASMAPRAPGQ